MRQQYKYYDFGPNRRFFFFFHSPIAVRRVRMHVKYARVAQHNRLVTIFASVLLLFFSKLIYIDPRCSRNAITRSRDSAGFLFSRFKTREPGRFSIPCPCEATLERDHSKPQYLSVGLNRIARNYQHNNCKSSFSYRVVNKDNEI